MAIGDYSQNEHNHYFGEVAVCEHCPLKPGTEIIENEAGGMRPYKSFWHDVDGVLIECSYGPEYWEPEFARWSKR